MKAKGLQKLRWYCQMCQKQCRDENGFKCHRMSDGHQRQMQLFTQDPNRFMDEFSQEFEHGFMHLMSHSYRSTRVLANTVYCDFISNRHHTHMNSTIWVTLSNFVQYLGRTQQCKIDKTPKGWYIEYLDNSPEARMKAAEKAAIEEAEAKANERHARMLREQIEDAVRDAGGLQESEFTELQRQEGDAPIAFAVTAKPVESKPATSSTAPGTVSEEGPNILAQAFAVHSTKKGGSRESSRDARDAEKGSKDAQEGKPRKLSAVESVMREHEAAKRQRLEQKAKPKEEVEERAWVAAGLVVKVMHKDLAEGKYYRKKGRIEKVHDHYTADVRMSESKALIRLEQEMLETVIPNVGKAVLVVKGTHRGRRGTMRSVDFEGFCVNVELEDGTSMEGLAYDEVCKHEP